MIQFLKLIFTVRVMFNNNSKYLSYSECVNSEFQLDNEFIEDIECTTVETVT